MKSRMLRLVLLCMLPTILEAQFTYTTDNGSVTIAGYTGPGGVVIIPDVISGLPVTSVGDSAFAGLSSLTTVTIPNSVTNIGNGAFEGCTSLAVIAVDALNSLYSSVAGVLFDKGQTTLIACPAGKAGSYSIPNSVTSIGDSAFYGCAGLTSVAIPDSVTRIGVYGFSGCAGLTNVAIGDSVTRIGDSAFEACTSLTRVTIPDSVTRIGNGAFEGCTSLTAIAVDALNSLYSSVAGVLFDKGQTTLIAYPAGRAGSYSVPNSVTSIGDSAFYGRTGLTRVTIPDSVTSIGVWAFSDCTSLTSVTIPNSVTRIGNYAFFGCTNLNSAEIGRGVELLGEGVFSRSGLTHITIPNSVRYIVGGNILALGRLGAFASCLSLTSVLFEGDGTGVEFYAFRDDPATLFYLPGTTGWSPNSFSVPIAIWQPQVVTADAGFGVRTNQFGFNIDWASGQTVVVEASTALVDPTWVPVNTNTLPVGSYYYTDPQWTNYPGRFYRLRSP